MLKIARRQSLVLILSAVSIYSISSGAAGADVISPRVGDRGRVYSNERPNTSMYGTGMSGRMSEASVLRFEGEQELDSDNIDEAIRKLGKSVQLDPGFPLGHVLYARAITKKFYDNQDKVDEVLLRRCIDEWKLVWHHDVDQVEQAEAKSEARKLMRLARALDKKKKQHAKALLAERKQFDAEGAEARRTALPGYYGVYCRGDALRRPRAVCQPAQR